MKKKLLFTLLVLVMLLAAFQMTALASKVSQEPIEVTVSWDDGFVYEGGIYDMGVHVSGTNADKATYRWQTDASFGKGSYYDLKDNQAWHGTKTDHLQLYTNSGVLYGTGWEKIPFRCLVTVDGKEYASPDFYIHVMPEWMLFSALEKRNEGFEEKIGVGIGGYDQILERNEEGFPVHATAYAGDMLGFAINPTNPSADFFSDPERSEVSFVPKIRITKNGSLVQSGDLQCFYTPHAAGDTLTVEHILYVKTAETDHGVYQSNKMTIDIIAPEAVASSTVKYDCSLLAERYNEAQKLISIPKGRTVGLIGNSGDTWYKVLYYNTVGYLPASALNIDNNNTVSVQITCDAVEVEMEEPLAGREAPYAVKTGSGYMLHSIEWYDTADDRYLEPGEFLKNDRIYTMTLWLAAENNCEFAVDQNKNIPKVKGLLNGKSIDVVKAYEQDPHKIVEINANYAPLKAEDHVCVPELVPGFAPTCKKEGQADYYQCKCGKNYKDAEAKQPVDITSWGILLKAPHIEGSWSYNGTHHYRKCTVCLEVIPGTNQTHDSDPCKVCRYVSHVCAPVLVPRVAPTCESEGFEQYYECSCGKTYKDAAATQPVDINSWGVLPKELHMYGEWTYNSTHHASLCALCKKTIPNTTAAHDGNPCKMCGFSTHVCRVEPVRMVDPTCESDGFEGYYICSCGKTYQDAQATQPVDLQVWGVIPKLPHSHGGWTYNSTHHASLCAYCNKTIPDTTQEHTGDVCTICGYTNPNAIREITSVNIGDVTVPEAGSAPDYTFTVGEGYEINQDSQAYEWMHRGISYYDITDGKYVSFRHTFVWGHQYQVYISLRPTADNVFGYVDAAVNGNYAESFGSAYDLTVCYTFPPCTARDDGGSRPIRR